MKKTKPKPPKKLKDQLPATHNLRLDSQRCKVLGKHYAAKSRS